MSALPILIKRRSHLLYIVPFPAAVYISCGAAIYPATASVNLSLFLQFKLLLIAYLQPSSQRQIVQERCGRQALPWRDGNINQLQFDFFG